MKNKTGVKVLIIGIVAIIILGGILFDRGFFNKKKTAVSLDSKSEEIIGNDAPQVETVQSDVSQSEIVKKDETVETNEKLKDDLKSNTTSDTTKSNNNDPVDKNTQSKEIVSPESQSGVTGSSKIVNKLTNFGYQKATGRKIDTVIVHSSYCAVGNDPFDMGCIIGQFKDYGVSAHYLIDRDGTVYRLVEEKNIAWHAGVAKVPDGRTEVNSFSIGIELMNTKSDKFKSDQYSALNKLLAQIKSEYSIKYVLGHDQVAPSRKDDPWNIEWGKVKK